MKWTVINAGFLTACAAPSTIQDTASAVSTERPWTATLPDANVLSAPRHWQHARVITHLHSAWSHDACDGEPLIDGVPDADCVDALRAALCTLQIDAAYLTDHPSHAAGQAFSELLHLRDEDEPLWENDQPIGAWMNCTDGQDPVLLRPGSEGDMMPLGLHDHPSDIDSYSQHTDRAIAQHTEAGAQVFVAHTEGRSLTDLQALQAAGLQGVEIFNIHAMFDPDIRSVDLGLDGLGWLADIAPFTSPDSTAEPDLFFLGVLAEQQPSVAAWDALQVTGQTVGIGGSDAHQNVWPSLLRDGERGDSYRRMLRWMSNHLLVAERSLEAVDEALAAGRLAVVFEVLGSPSGLDVHIVQDGQVLEMGARSAQTAGVLHVNCPSLSNDSPQGPMPPDIVATVFRNGQVWQEGCGAHTLEGPGVYRVRVDITPWHLTPFLGDDPEPWLVKWPWIYTNPIVVGLD